MSNYLTRGVADILSGITRIEKKVRLMWAKANIEKAREALESLDGTLFRATWAKIRMHGKYDVKYWSIEDQMFNSRDLKNAVDLCRMELDLVEGWAEKHPEDADTKQLERFLADIEAAKNPLVALIDHEKALDDEAEKAPALRGRIAQLEKELMEERRVARTAERERALDDAMKQGQDVLAFAEVEFTKSRPDRIGVARRLRETMNAMRRELARPSVNTLALDKEDVLAPAPE